MMIRKLGLAIAVMATVGFHGTALAANCATVTVSPAAPAIPQWNPLNGAAQEASFTVTMTRDAASTKRAKLIFLDSNSNASPTRIGTTTGPRYDILNMDAGSTLVSFPQGTQVASVNIPDSQFSNRGDATLSFKVRIRANTSPQEEFTGGTSYTETLRYSVQCFKANGQDNGTDSAVQSNLQLNLTIPKLLSIVTAAPDPINFQNFTTAEEQTLIRIRSTSTLNVSAVTANNGKLMAGTSTAENAIIPYSMRFGVSGSNPLPALPLNSQINATRAGVTGKDYALRLILTDGVPSGKIAGAYSDTITLTITPGQ
jgi:hypothetical protein